MSGEPGTPSRDWFDAFRIECQKHNETKRERDRLREALRVVADVPINAPADTLDRLVGMARAVLAESG